jgi:hypothetical protein
LAKRSKTKKKGKLRTSRILDARRQHMRWLDELDALPISEEHRDMAEHIGDYLERVIWLFTELDHNFVDLFVCYRMASRYPWSRKYIRRSEHLNIVWLCYANLCYLFEERVKNAINSLRGLERLMEKKPDVTKYVKWVERELGAVIKARGRHMHRGQPSSETIVMY